MQLTASDLLSVVEVQWLLTSTRFDEWMQNDVFHLRWWILLGIFVISVYVWWKMTDKSRLIEITLYAVLVSILTLVLDELGEELCLWYYPTDLFPLFPPITAINLASLPMIYSLIYQYFGTWKKFIIATIVMAAIFSFVLEPLFVLGGIYQMLTWKYYYSFPLYIALAIFIKAVVGKLYSITNKN
ncbi:MAG TPA: CBO0543 family protein [Syntrophomonadaceae bacterium]|nr:CBO0543 family protein [Syntrophomonadaceae bacterium]